MSETKRRVVEASQENKASWGRLPSVHELILARLRRTREKKQNKGRIRVKRCVENL